MKIYISGPITGTTDYMERFARMQEALEGMGHTVVNPAKVNAELPEGTTHEEYMTMCRPMIDMCEVVLMMEGWQQSKGCRMEFDYATKKRITITFEGSGGKDVQTKGEQSEALYPGGMLCGGGWPNQPRGIFAVR